MNARNLMRILGAVLLTMAALTPNVFADEVKRMGILFAGAASQRGNLETALMDTLRERGYVEGRNLVVTRRYAQGDYTRLAEYARELESMKPDVVVTMCTPSTRAMSHASASIPIVMTMIADPVGQKLVTSLAHPGGNLTGTAAQYEDTVPKMLEAFAGMLPKQGRVAVLSHAKNQVHGSLWAIAEVSAQRLQLRATRYDVAGPEALPGVLEAVARDRQEAILVLPDDPMFTAQRAVINQFATRGRLPTIYSTLEAVEAGALLSYGQSFADGYRQAGLYVDRVLHGAKPDSLPVAQPTKFDLSVNLKTAREIGVTIPQRLLMRADKIVE